MRDVPCVGARQHNGWRRLLAAFALLALLAISCQAQSPVEVKSAEELQEAVTKGARYIHITRHLVLTGLHPNTSDQGSVVFPKSPGDVAIWGDCDSSDLPSSVQTYVGQHSLQRSTYGSCSLFTETTSENITAASERYALQFDGDGSGRLFLTNIVINTAGSPDTVEEYDERIKNTARSAFGVSVANGELWLVHTVLAFFLNAAVKAVDSHVFIVDTLTYQWGALTDHNGAGVDFLEKSDRDSSQHPLTLYAFSTTFHQDNLHEEAPIYVGPVVSDATTSVVLGTRVSALKSNPQIILDSTFAHTHEKTQGDGRGCTGICICAAGVAQPVLFLNTTDEPKMNYFTLDPKVNPVCNSNTTAPSFQPATAIPWDRVVPPGHTEWANTLIAAGVPNADRLLNPTGRAPSSDSLGAGAIVGIVIAIIATVALAAALAFCFWRRRRRAAAAAAAAAAKEDGFGDPAALPGDNTPFHPIASQHPSSYGAQVPPNYAYGLGSMQHQQSGGYGPGPGSLHHQQGGYGPGSAIGGGSSFGSSVVQPGQLLPGPYPGKAGSVHSSHPGAPRSHGSADPWTLSLQSTVQSTPSNEGNAAFASLTQQRAQAGVPVDASFEYVDSLLDEVERHWESTLMGRYVILGSNKRSYGGQGMVQFAVLKFNTEKEVAIKFFLSRTAFNTEQALYLSPSLHAILPPIDDVGSNEDGRYTDPYGRLFPPFVVMEKGQPLDTWSKRSKPDFTSSLQIIHHLVKRIAELHAAGLCHRDLKPSNTIWLSSRNEWTIIDFGSTATIGEAAPLSVSFAYAAPETMRARVDGLHEVVADGAVDVWSLGVMGIELLTGSPTYQRDAGRDFEQVVISYTLEGHPFPWEDPAGAPQLRKRLGFMNDMLLRMVSRDPRLRPSLREVDAEWRRLLQQGTVLD